MSKILSPAQVEQYSRDGFAFPVPVLDAGRGARTARRSRILGEAAGPSARLSGEEQVVPALSLGGHAGASSQGARCGRGRDRARHPGLSLDDVDQGAAHAGLCALAPGRRLFLPRSAGARDGLGGALRGVGAGGLHAGDPGHASPADDRARRQARPAQHDQARPGHQPSASTARPASPMPLGAGELSLHHTALVHCSPGNDNERPPHGPRHQLRSGACAPARAGEALARCWCAARTATAISCPRRGSRRRCRPRRRPPMPRRCGCSACARTRGSRRRRNKLRHADWRARPFARRDAVAHQPGGDARRSCRRSPAIASPAARQPRPVAAGPRPAAALSHPRRPRRSARHRAARPAGDLADRPAARQRAGRRRGDAGARPRRCRRANWRRCSTG